MVKQHVPFLSQVTAPAEEPLTLSEAKLFLRVDITDDDSIITRLITTARKAAETYMRRSIITQQWALIYDDYAPCQIFLPRGPVQTVDVIRMIASDDSQAVVDGALYSQAADSSILNVRTTLISHRVEILYTAGFGLAASVPDEIKQGMLLHISAMYDDRANSGVLNGGSQGLYDPYKILSL